MSIPDYLNYFIDIPNEYKADKEKIDKLKIIYNKEFNFHYFQFKPTTNEEEFKKQTLNYLNNIKFITYQIHDKYPFLISTNNKCNSIICVEKNCLIIEMIDIELINSIINEVKSSKINTNENISKIKSEIEDEIRSFYRHFSIEIRKNKFVKYTYKPLIVFLIRRNFYPSNFFKNQSFYDFGEYLKQKKVLDYKTQKLIEFDEKDFIQLRLINSSHNKVIYLALHIESFCLVGFKKIDRTNQKIIDRKIHFFTNHIHRCILKCYGYIKDENIYTFVTEFMSNGSIDTYMSDHENEINFFYSFMSMNRIFQSLNYLHSQNLIHRDIKPSNIFVNHDNLPFLSDFDTIRSADPKTEMTSNIGSMLFSSPEQNGEFNDKFIKISYPTDIYSFGILIYFLFEKKYETDESTLYEYMNNNKSLEFTKTPKNIQYLILNCVKYLPKERLEIKDIKNIIIMDIFSRYYLEPDFLNGLINNLSINHITSFLTENTVLISQYTDIYNSKLNLENIFSILLKSKNISSFLLNLGCMYKEGKFGKSEFKKAKEILEISAKFKNSVAYYFIGQLYHDGDGVDQDYGKALEYYNKSAEMGYSFAYIKIGNLYLNGRGVNKDFLMAKKYYEKSAELGNSEALNGLAVICFKHKKNEEGLAYIKKSAEQNNTNALIRLANIYLRGILTEYDFAEAKRLYEKAVHLNESEGYIGLGAIYLGGLGIDKNYDLAKYNYEQAAKLNNSNAYIRLGHMYMHGYGVSKNYVKAKEYFEISSGKGNSNAWVDLGILYLYGLGVEQNFLKTKECFEKAEKKNNSNALCGIGFLYLMGLGVERNYQKAKEYFEKSILKDNSNAYIYIGNMYFFGQGVNKSWSEAKNYYDKYIQKTDSFGAFYKGKQYYYGYDNKKDYIRAIDYFKEATKCFNSRALFYIGHCYLNGYGVKKDSFKAIEHYSKAADEDNLEALNELGKIYLKGVEGIDIDYQKAKHYFDLSSQGNNADALYYLGKMYYLGLGVEKNYKVARDYFQISANHFNMKAYYYLGRIFEKGEGTNIDLTKSIGFYNECVKIYLEIFISYTENGWDEDSHINKFYYSANNDLGLIYINETEYKNIKKADHHLKISGLSEYPFGKNSLGLFYELYLNKKEKAIQFFESAANKNFALSEFNLARLYEKDEKRYDISIQYLCKVIQHENEPLAFLNHFYYDEQLEISKSFITCIANLKLCLYYLSQNNIVSSQKYFINAIFRPIFKYLFSDYHQSYSFNIEIIFDHNKKITTNFGDFIINFPMYQYNNVNPKSSTWDKTNNNNLSKTILLNYKASINRNHENNAQRKKIEMIDDIIIETINLDDELDNIFDYYNNNKKFKRINSGQENEFIFIKNDDTIRRDLKYPSFDFILKHFKYMKNEIIKIVNALDNILIECNYSILFGRMFRTKKSSKMKNVSNEFYEGFGLD